MNKTIHKSVYLCLFIIFTYNLISAQNFRLDEINKNRLRNLQLLGKLDSSISFNVQNNSFAPEVKLPWNKKRITILDLILTQQFNTKYAYGWNDGPIMQSVGYQVFGRPGVNFQFGKIELQIAPELFFNNSQSYAKILPGQSYFKIHLGPISVGLSSENLWWGPGINSALLMSNNAPGFPHAFIGTNKPFKTPIGNFEFNLIGGNLNSNKKLPYEIINNQFSRANNNWRYLNSYVISWQPKWIKGLFVGVSRSLQQYGGEVQSQKTGFISKYLPVIGLAVQKKNNLGDDTLGRDQLASLFIRWIFPKSNSEFYLEYGKNDYGTNIRDYLLPPSHSYAYTLGFRKLIPQNDNRYLQLETELTQMSQSPDYLVRGAGNWYEHGYLYQGYTNNNQILGAGAGFGANVQTVSASWIDGQIRNGFLIQRVERDPVYKVYKWTDISIGWMPQWKYRNMLLGAKVQLIRSNNYNWEKGNHSFNLHSRLMIQYNFK